MCRVSTWVKCFSHTVLISIQYSISVCIWIVRIGLGSFIVKAISIQVFIAIRDTIVITISFKQCVDIWKTWVKRCGIICLITV